MWKRVQSPIDSGRRSFGLAFFLLAATLGFAATARSAAAELVGVARLECGRIQVNHGALFSDAFAYSGRSFPLVESCYLIRHGDEYLLWDSGLSPSALNADLSADRPIVYRLDTTLATQFAQAGFDTSRISFVGISHYHPDHTGQLADFSAATLLIGAADWSLLISAEPPGISNVSDLSHWVADGGSVLQVSRDLDVFGDGTVTILATPGHTPGHKSLLVKLAHAGNIVLTGDLAHFRENYEENRVPVFNVDRADTLASLDRVKILAVNLDAKVVIQHDPDDTDKLAAFPQWTE